MTSAEHLDDLMRRGWPALEEVDVDGWAVRLSGGATRRANSALPARTPIDASSTLARVEALYQERGLPAAVQVSPAGQPAMLSRLLADRAYALVAPTSVEAATIDGLLIGRSAEHQVDADEAPDAPWLELWSAVDGRGGPREREIDERIAAAGPALFASICEAAGRTAVGRAPLVDDWAGIYCMAVRPDARRQGRARAVLSALLRCAHEHGAQRTWLQVSADNAPARALYRDVGFRPVSSYHYRVRAKA